jgi:hypothetical protein
MTVRYDEGKHETMEPRFEVFGPLHNPECWLNRNIKQQWRTQARPSGLILEKRMMILSESRRGANA